MLAGSLAWLIVSELMHVTPSCTRPARTPAPSPRPPSAEPSTTSATTSRPWRSASTPRTTRRQRGGLSGQARPQRRADALPAGHARPARADLARLRHPPAGQRLRALRVRAADRQARAPAHQLPGRATSSTVTWPTTSASSNGAPLGGRVVVARRSVAPALAALLDPEHHDHDDHRRQVEQRVVPVAGVGQRQRGHWAAADRRGPRLVKATMTASIQYCERVTWPRAFKSPRGRDRARA